MTETQAPIDVFAGLGPDGWSTLTHLSRAFRVKESGLQNTLDAIIRSSVEAIPEAEYASVNILERGKFVPQAAVGDPPNELDALQQRIGEGPCMVASATQTVVRIDDMNTESRWPEYAKLANHLGVRSMLCVPLWVDDVRLGSLSLYCPTENGLTNHHELLATLFAGFSALALVDAQRADNLRRVADNRDVIGQAKGILMERYGITADEAFARLSQASQKVNKKLLEVAETLASTGALVER